MAKLFGKNNIWEKSQVQTEKKIPFCARKGVSGERPSRKREKMDQGKKTTILT